MALTSPTDTNLQFKKSNSIDIILVSKEVLFQMQYFPHLKGKIPFEIKEFCYL